MPDWLYTTVPLLAAITYALAFRQRATLRCYFAAQLLATVAIEGARLGWVSRTAVPFGIVYAGATVLVLLAAQLFVWDQLLSVWRRIYVWRVATAATTLATVPTVLAYFDLAKPLRYYDWLYLVEAFALLGQATTLALICRLLGAYRDVSLTLIFIWLTLAGFRLGFALHLPDGVWVRLNSFVPYVVVVGGFLTIGRLLGRLRWTASA